MALIAPSALDALLASLADRAGTAGCDAFDRLVHVTRLPAVDATTATLARPLPPAVAARAPASLWSHQVAAIDRVRAGRSVVVASGTASGKSLCYQLPIAEAASRGRPGTAILVFPTKALAHDQLRALTALGLPGVTAGAYDGDASPEERTWIRRNANVVLTNPEMLHCGILPQHNRWSTFLSRLSFVVVDELHSFRGVFGSHVAHVLRRLRRLAAHHGAAPAMIGCSATIGEPGRLATTLWGDVVDPILDDGSPRGERLIAVWNPPLLDAEAGLRSSAHVETAGIVADLVEGGHRTLAFCRSRRITEVVSADARRRLGPADADRIRAYRGGYLAEERREVEDLLFAGRLDGVIATNALELGIDVGGLDAVVLDGFPGTIASFWQQAGRAGREHQPSAAVLVAGRDQLDQWLVANPTELLTRTPEPAVINPGNPFVLDAHLRCAAHELPLRHADERWWSGMLDDGVRRLALDGDLAVRPRPRRGSTLPEPAAVWDGAGWPTNDVGLRSGRAGEVRIVADDGVLVGTVDIGRAPDQVHAGASYLHQGRAWRVVELDLDERTASVEPDDGSTYTAARSDIAIRLLGADRCERVGRARACLGEVEVTTRVVGYQRKDAMTHEVLENEPLELPPSTLPTRATWFVIPNDVLDDAGLDRASAPGALHAAEHAAIGMLPLFAICDRWDVGGVSTARHRDTGAPTIVIYDGYPGGVGVAELAFEAADAHLRATLASIEACGCRSGCPSCVQSPKCGNGNEPLDKAGGASLLRALLAI